MSNKKTALYCRMAAAPKCDDVAMLTQKETLLRYAKEQGYTNAELYEDNGVSGLAFPDRPALRKLQADIEAGGVERVIVRSLSRVGRNTGDVYRWLTELDARGVAFICLDFPEATAALLRKLFEDMGWGADRDE